MKQVIQALKRADAKKRISVLRLEINYELAMLHEALIEEDTDKVQNSKQKLERLRQEWIELEAGCCSSVK